MKVTVIGSHLCPDTLYALNRLSEAGAEIDFKNLSASLSDLKAYLALRQDSPVYADIRENGGIGIPCVIVDAGTATRDLWAVLKLQKVSPHSPPFKAGLLFPRRGL